MRRDAELSEEKGEAVCGVEFRGAETGSGLRLSGEPSGGFAQLLVYRAAAERAVQLE